MNDVNRLFDLIYEIKYYKIPENKEDKQLNLILGQQKGKSNDQSYYKENGTISYYMLFEEFAFLSRNDVRINSSETKVFSMLLNCSLEDSKWFLKNIKLLDLVQPCIDYLYYEHNILMINKLGKSNLFTDLFKKDKVKNLLILGEETRISILKSIYKDCPDLKVLRIPHPSPKSSNHIADERWMDCNVRPTIISLELEKQLPKTSQVEFRLKID